MTRKEKIMGTPGTGKTTALIASYQTLLNEGCIADDITCTTFRKPSANDLIDRIFMATGQDYKNLKDHVSTMHSICYRLIDKPKLIGTKDFKDFAEKYGYINEFNMNSSAPDTDEIVFSGKLNDLYAWFRNTRTPIDNWYLYPGIENINIDPERIPEFVEDFTNYKEKIGKIDYTDMIEFVLEDKIELDTPILMVDEFQDLTKQQYELFKMWEKNCSKIIIAGDPLQSLYGFFGGSPEYFNTWKGKEHTLSKSHRLLNPIWEMAQDIILPTGQYPPEVEATPTADIPIHWLKHGTYDYQSNATQLHLVRCNYQAQPLSMELAAHGILFSGKNGWTEHEIKLYNTILKVREGELLNAPEIKTLLENYDYKQYFNYDGPKTKFLKYLKTYTPTQSLTSHLKPELQQILMKDTPIYYCIGSKQGNLKVAKIHTQLKIRKSPITESECKRVSIMTIHGSKGLEAEEVYLHTGISKTVNNSMKGTFEGSQEEARVWYVGITRTMKRLYLIHDEGKNYPLPMGYV